METDLFHKEKQTMTEEEDYIKIPSVVILCHNPYKSAKI